MTEYSHQQLQDAALLVSLTWHRLVFRAGLAGVMRPPVFELSTTRSFGSWEPSTRTFSIQRRLAVRYGDTQDFIDTVAHELAHQWVSEVARFVGEPSHGRAWRQAARLFGADPRATARCRLDTLCGSMTDDDRRVLRKVKGLLALSSSPNEHEAEQAALRARELMCRYQLSLRDMEGRATWDFKTLGAPRKQRPRWLFWIPRILSRFYHVETIWLRESDPEYDRDPSGSDGNPEWVLEVTGTPAAVAVAEYVHDFLVAEGERRLTAYRRDGGASSRTARLDFLEGLYEGFFRKLERQTAELERSLARSDPSAASTALVLVGDSERRSFFRSRYPRIAKSSASARSTFDPEARGEGRRQGKELTVRNAVTTSSQGPALLPR